MSGFYLELHLCFICPSYMTGSFTISYLSCSLRNEINMICCVLKTTNNSETNALTNTRFSWYDKNSSRNYRKTSTYDIKYYWKWLFQPNLSPNRAVFAISAQWFYIILHDIFLCLSITRDVWKIYFNDSLNL